MAAVLVGFAGPAVANEWDIQKPPSHGTCYSVFVHGPDGEPRGFELCIP